MQALQNMGAILKAGNSSFEDVVKTTVLMASMDDYATINEIYSKCTY
jgi:2-iminobutanoate/2-iminopropanoate deaminase